MEKLFPAAGAWIGSTLLSKFAPELATLINESPLVAGGVGGLIEPVTEQGVATGLGITGGIVGATGGSALSASLEGVLKGGEQGPKLPMPAPNFLERRSPGIPASSRNAASFVVPRSQPAVVGMMDSPENMLRRLLAGR